MVISFFCLIFDLILPVTTVEMNPVFNTSQKFLESDLPLWVFMHTCSIRKKRPILFFARSLGLYMLSNNLNSATFFMSCLSFGPLWSSPIVSFHHLESSFWSFWYFLPPQGSEDQYHKIWDIYQMRITLCQNCVFINSEAHILLCVLLKDDIYLFLIYGVHLLVFSINI